MVSYWPNFTSYCRRGMEEIVAHHFCNQVKGGV